jgi:hypothetical protein
VASFDISTLTYSSNSYTDIVTATQAFNNLPQADYNIIVYQGSVVAENTSTSSSAYPLYQITIGYDAN